MYRLLLGLIISISAAANPVPSGFTYANGQTLIDAEGTIYFHDGSVLYRNEKMYWPAWKGGGIFRERRGFAAHLFYSYPDGAPLVEHTNYINYHAEHGQASQPMTDNYSYYYRTYPAPALSRDGAAFRHPNGRAAWDRNAGIFLENGAPTDNLFLGDDLRRILGGWFVNLFHESGRVNYEAVVWLDPFEASYLSPIVYSHLNGIPSKPLLSVLFQIETGYPRELVTFFMGEDDQAKLELETTEGPFPVQGAYLALANSLAAAAARHPMSDPPSPTACAKLFARSGTHLMHRDPPGFVRRQNPR